MIVLTDYGAFQFNGCMINDDDEPLYYLEVTHSDGNNYRVFKTENKSVCIDLMRDLLDKYDRGRRKYSIVDHWTETGRNKEPAKIFKLQAK